MTLTPAHGRDYKSVKAVLADFDADKDFIIEDMCNAYCGKPVNRAQLVETGIRNVNIRYAKLSKVTVVSLSP